VQDEGEIGKRPDLPFNRVVQVYGARGVGGLNEALTNLYHKTLIEPQCSLNTALKEPQYSLNSGVGGFK
jgi:hypothetical protein